jgi:ADP-ribosyl-[dinitrogen reductase] hydrolase
MSLTKEKQIPDLPDRCRGAIWGEFVGDAVCLGAHWIYDLNEIKNSFPGGVAGFETPASGHYHAGKRSGDFTHYGDAALLMLQSIARLGTFSPQDFGTRFVTLFSSEGYHGYRDHATKGTLENYYPFAAQFPNNPYHFQAGADDDQPATATRLAPVVVAHYRDPELIRIVESATRVCQNNSRAVIYMKCHALIIKALLSGCGLEDAFQSAAKAVSNEPEYGQEVIGAAEAVFSQLDQEVGEVTLRFGQSCPLKSSFPAAMHAALKYQDDPRRAILESANAGGDNAARCAMIGTWLGALQGVNGIPSEWRAKVNDRDEIESCIEKIVRKVGSEPAK